MINECTKKNIDIYPLPGASAVTTAFSVSGFSESYFFYGFFPEKVKYINEDLTYLSNLKSSLIFFVSPKKINKAIPHIKEYFNSRKILICREMTKFYEEYLRCDVNDLKLFKKELKGELTVVISPKQIDENSSVILSESDKMIIQKMIHKLSTKEITNLIGQKSKVSKKNIYNYCLKLKNEK